MSGGIRCRLVLRDGRVGLIVHNLMIQGLGGCGHSRLVPNWNGDHNRALRYYQKIDAIDHAIGSRSLRLRYKLYMLACYISLQRIGAATDLLSECEELSILVSDKNLTGQIHLYRAKLHRLQKEYNEALLAISQIQYATGKQHTFWLSIMVSTKK